MSIHGPQEDKELSAAIAYWTIIAVAVLAGLLARALL